MTCDERLQSAALDSTVPSSLSPSSMDALFLRRGPRQQSKFQARDDRPSDGSRAEKQKPTQQALVTRPRRLPTLIKILTGFGDEPYWNNQSSGSGSSDTSAGNNKPIIAGLKRPPFIAEAQRRRASASKEQLSYEETVQMAAAAAAAAVWSKSLRIFGNHRMQRVNAEWDAALRWIAGWDQQHHIPSTSSSHSLDGRIDLRAIRVNDSVTLHGGESSDASQEGFNTFVDDLAKMLDSCINQCIDGENVDDQTRNDTEGRGVAVAASIGVMVLRCFIQWIVGCSLPKLSFNQLGIKYLEGISILNKSFQLITSSVAAYYVYCGMTWASQAIFHWYSSFGYTESPEWLLDHEKEIQLAKSSRARQRKKAKRRELTKRTFGRSKSVPSNYESKIASRTFKDTPGDDDLPPKRSVKADKSALPSGKSGGKSSRIQFTEKWQNESDSDDPAPFSTDSASGSRGSNYGEDIPSMISCPSTSVTSISSSPSPPFKPIGSRVEDQEEIPYISPLLGRSQPILGLNPHLISQGPLVPTQEQRDEAAKQLREFQNSQIQRLLRQRQLLQNWNDNRLSANSTAQSIGLLHGSSFHSGENSFSALSLGQKNKVLKPPPGLVHPSDTQTSCRSDLHNQNDTGFLTDNELFLSKLLDDEEDDVKVKAPSSVRIGTRSLSPESSLDPSAVPFFSLTFVGTQQSSTLIPKSEKERGDAWQSSPGEVSLNSNSPTRMMKGVYGGSVW
jgi:hypothetical protein